MTVAPASLCAISSGVQKQYGSWMIALFKLVGSKQIRSLGVPLLLSVDSTKTKLFIHGVASWTGLMTLAASIFSISCQKVCFRWTGMGLHGVCLGVMDGLRWIWYGSPGNLPMPLKSSGYCSWICSFDFTILTVLGVFSWGTVEVEVGRMDVVDCVCTSLLGWSAALDMSVTLGGRYSNLGLTSRSCSWKIVSHDKRTLPSSFAI